MTKTTKLVVEECFYLKGKVHALESKDYSRQSEETIDHYRVIYENALDRLSRIERFLARKRNIDFVHVPARIEVRER